MINMLKREYTDELDRKYYSLDFVDEKTRNRVERISQAWDQRIKTLFDIGHHMVQNGQALEGMGDVAEGRVRVWVGMKLMGWGECLLFEAKDHHMDKMNEEIEELVQKVKKALGGDEAFQKAIKETEEEAAEEED